MTVLSAHTIIGDKVVNKQNENLGDIKELMIDLDTGKVTYAVLEFGSFLGMGGKLFAVPINAMQVDTDRKCFVLDQPKEALKNAPGYDKDHWPDFADSRWTGSIDTYYSSKTH